MRRLVAIIPWMLAIGLLIAGGWFWLKASCAAGMGLAAPALSALACLMVAAALIGRQSVRWVAYPVTSLFGHVFYPQSHFTRPPQSLLVSLRGRIAEGRLRSAAHEIEGLLKAYPRDDRLYHAWALLEAAKGRSVEPVTAEASRALSSARFVEYEALLRAMPPRAGKRGGAISV